MGIPTPLIIINLKTYEAGSDLDAERIARACQHAADKSHVGVAIACQAADVFRLTKDTTLPLLCQHVDPVGYGAHTGATIIETMKCNGAVGTLLNHSERRVSMEHIKEVVTRAKRLKFITIVCAKDTKEAGVIAKLKPDYVAVEPPELIGGTISVADAHPRLVQDAVKAVGRNSKLIVGAGVKTSHDVQRSIELGAHGVLVASGVVQARNTLKEMQDLISGME